MKTLYIECKMGASGDMLMSALLHIHPNAEDFVRRFNSLGIKDTELIVEKGEKCGISGVHARILINSREEFDFEREEKKEHTHHHDFDCKHCHDIRHEHNHEHEHHHEHNHSHHHEHDKYHSHHTHLKDIQEIIEGFPLSENIKKAAAEVYELIAKAESKVHGTDIDNIHFHEVGTIDAIADVTGVCMLMEEIGAERIIVSPVNTGGGTVKCAHGILPVPTPATAELLKDCLSYSDSDEGEFCTPTGAALIKYFADDFGYMPVMRTEKTGIGLGSKNFSRANILRVFLGEELGSKEDIFELSCNIDDMTGEETAFAAERIFEAGAKDVSLIPIIMKKGRQGVKINCMCRETEKRKVVEAIFKHTSTLGIREYSCKRYVLDREEIKRNTEYGAVRLKISQGYGTQKEKYEYDDLSRIAIENDTSLSDIKKNMRRK